ncbi:MAG: acyl carrier protein [Clostridia bacterium]|nr:acyl carrier protein [Clostridia bacterium]
MNEKEILEKLTGIIVDQLGVSADQVKPKATFVEDLAADSLDIVELVMSIEEEFDLQIADEEAEHIVTVNDVITYIKNNK